MTLLRDLPVVWFVDDATTGPELMRVAKYVPTARKVNPEDLATLANVIAEVKGEWLVLLRQGLLPFGDMLACQLEPALVIEKIPHAYLSRNSVTGEIIGEYGVEIWHIEALLTAVSKGELPARPHYRVPTLIADWYCNPDPLKTYENAHSEMSRLIADDHGIDREVRVSLRASLGSDAKYGDAWKIGACHAALGLPDRQDQERKTLEDPAACRQRARDLLREVRLKTSLEVFDMTAVESRMVKDTILQMPHAEHYQKFADLVDTLNDLGRQRAELYREAAKWLWGARSN